MVQRISSTRLASGGSPFDPLRISRAAYRGAELAQPIVEGLDAVAARRIEISERDARINTRVETSRIERELAGDLEEIRGNVEESGAGYTKAAMDALSRRQADALRRAGDDPIKRDQLERQFRIEKEEYQKTFESGERDMGRSYRLFQIEQTLDDGRQQVSRTNYMPSGRQFLDRFKASLGGTESGWNYSIVNSEGYGGKYQFGEARLSDFARETGRSHIPMSEFLKNPKLQEEAMDWSVSKIQKYIIDNDLDEYEGKVVGGVRVSLGGMLAAAHLSGEGGLKAFLKSGGADNRKDSNRTKVSDYMRIHGMDGNGIPIYNGKLPDITKDPVFASARDDILSQIDALDISKLEKSKLRKQAIGNLTTAAIERLGSEDASAALAVLRSGALDKDLDYGADRALTGQFKNVIERRITRMEKERMMQMREESTAQASDVIQYQVSGADMSQAPEPLTQDQYYSLSPSQRRSYDQSFQIGDAVRSAQNVDLAVSGDFLESIKPSGKGFAGEVKAYQAAQKVIEDRLVQDRVESHINGARSAGISPDMSDRDIKDAVDFSFDQAISQSENVFSAASSFMLDNNVVPDRFNDLVSQVMSGDNIDQKVEASRYVRTVLSEDPDLASQMKGPGVKSALLMGEYLNLGLSPDDAQDMVKKSMFDPSPEKTKAMRSQYKSEKMQDDAFDMFQDTINSVKKAPISEADFLEYSTLVESEFARTGNLDAAVSLASHAFMQSHNVTEIGGVRRWSRDAPEAEFKVYGDERDTNYIEDQAMIFAGERVKGNIDAISLVPTGRQINGKPTYNAMVVVDGVYEMVQEPFQPNPEPERALIEDIQRSSASDTENMRGLSKARLRLNEARNAVKAARENVISSDRDPSGRSAAYKGLREAIKARDEALREMTREKQELDKSMRKTQDIIGKTDRRGTIRDRIRAISGRQGEGVAGPGL